MELAKKKILKYCLMPLKGNCTPNQKLACFVLYLKIINTLKKIIMYAS